MIFLLSFLLNLFVAANMSRTTPKTGDPDLDLQGQIGVETSKILVSIFLKI